MKYTKHLFLLLGIVLMFSGCATPQTYDTTDASGHPVSSQPWNNQATWENTGQLGNALGAGGLGH